MATVKLSAVSLSDVKKALRIDYSHDDALIEDTVMPSAMGRLQALTGINDITTLDNYPELVLAYMLICNDYYDGTEERSKAYMTIIHSCQIHLLGGGEE